VRVLVIGGTGFIGSPLVGSLVHGGHDVAVFHRGAHAAKLPPGVRQVVGDRRHLADFGSDFRTFRPEVVVDVILSSGRQAQELMSLFRGVAARVLALSSMDVYRACGVLHGLEPGELEPLPLTESSRLRTKLQTYPPEQIRILQQVFGWLDEEYDKIPVEQQILGDSQLPGTVLRLPMVYGPGDRLHRFHPIVKRIEDGRRVILFSDAMARWRATRGYVENVAAAIAIAATTDRAVGRVYNVGEPDTLTELEWAQCIASAMAWTGGFVVRPDDRVPPHVQAPGNAAQHWVADTTRLREETGFREPVARDESIRRTVEWERANPPAGFTPHQFDYEAEDAALRV
jgi:nucleoside-diphosphate-sugar epimerase